MLALILGRPDLAAVRRQPRLMLGSILPAIYGLGGAAVVLAALAGLASLIYGSPDAALAHLRGQRISLYSRLVDVGIGASGEERKAEVEVVNRNDHAIRLIGGARD